METIEIGIIGGTGGIGRWFVPFLTGEGYPVHVAGRKTGLSLPELAARCRAVIVAVPIAATAEAIGKIGPLLPEDALLMDFTSLKAAPVREMLRATRAEVVGCHPLFGPDCPSLEGQNVVLCPARGEKWLGWIEKLLRTGGARVTRTTPEEHDRMMALIQGLTHLDTILMGLSLRDAGIDEAALEAFTTPVFRTKRAIVEKVFTQSPALYAEILTGNPHLTALLDRHGQNLSRLRELILSRNAAGIEALLRKSGPDSPARL
jgi:prephenate dehydrogenase